LRFEEASYHDGIDVPTAFVTGASRGIGRATAVALALAGFDVAITARTVHEGDGVDESDTGSGRVIPGSLDSTSAEIRAAGRRVIAVPADLHDASSLEAAVNRVLEDWGRIDVLVNNAVDTGPGSMVPFVDLTIDQLERKLFANCVAQAVVIKAVLPAMFAAGNGVIIDVSSHVATGDPIEPVGSGGWGLAYAASKAAFHRFAPILAVELAERGIRIHNVDPGYVETERQMINAAALGLEGRYPGAPPSVPAAVIAWLATAPEAHELNGQTVQAQRLALRHALHPDWRPNGFTGANP
jgi:NAD(P)-dependent dehydrogenase (short-subunit alcohol dehydrogenase family)